MKREGSLGVILGSVHQTGVIGKPKEKYRKRAGARVGKSKKGSQITHWEGVERQQQ